MAGTSAIVTAIAALFLLCFVAAGADDVGIVGGEFPPVSPPLPTTTTCAFAAGGVTFNLSSLMRSTALPYAITDENAPTDSYFFNVCADAEPPHLENCERYGTLTGTAWQVSKDAGTCYRLGWAAANGWNFSLIDPQKPSTGLSLTYPGGNNVWCHSGTNRTFSLNILCGTGPPAGSGTGMPSTALVVSMDSCSYTMELTAPQGCPTACVTGDTVCSGHGSCAYDAATGMPACACDVGWCGSECDLPSTAPMPSPTRQPIPPSSSVCLVDLGNATFDLSPLQTATYYPVTDSSNNRWSYNYSWYLGVCNDVNAFTLPGALGAMCNVTVAGWWDPTLPLSGPAPVFAVSNVPVPLVDACHRFGASLLVSPPQYSPLDPADPASGVLVRFSGGDLCPPTDGLPPQPRSFKLRLACDPQAVAFPTSAPMLMLTFGCSYELLVSSRAACPLECPMGPSPTTGHSALCSDQGTCAYDSTISLVRCKCLPGFSGVACEQGTSPPGCAAGKPSPSAAATLSATRTVTYAPAPVPSGAAAPRPASVAIEAAMGSAIVVAGVLGALGAFMWQQKRQRYFQGRRQSKGEPLLGNSGPTADNPALQNYRILA